MSDEMIERVAKAIRIGVWINGDMIADFGLPISDSKEIAKAAIKAMMEPTEKMLEAGMWIHPGGEIVGSGAAKEVWQSMIDAIFHD